jgi:hypothetical protein
MREFLTIASLVGLTIGVVVFTYQFLQDRGMTYSEYRDWLTVLLSFSALISNAAIAYYFSKQSARRKGDREREAKQE